HNDPFDPHAIAHLRPIAYQKVIVMNYINNLIAWGDSLFKQYTIEDINEAEMLYVMAYDLLGKKPVDVASPPLPAVETLNGILALNNRSLDNVHEFLVSIEENQSSTFLLKDNPANYIPGDYFGIPENENFSSYWDTVKQRLYDIRNGLNIDGQKEALPLFQPPISPMELVAQIASGESLAKALNPRMSAVPYYRFKTIVQKAKEVCSTVIQLGQALLSALEKKDAAQLQLLLNLNQQHIQAITMAGKQENINQINASIQALEAGLTSAQQRQQYYQNLISAGLLPKEKTQITLQESAIASQTAANAIRVGAVIMYNIPTVFGFSDGSFQPGSSVSESAAISDGVGAILSASSGMAGTQAAFQRRTEEWNFQVNQAENETLQATNQIQSAQYQLRIIQQDMDVTQQRIAQEQKVESFMKNKFTNEQLYEWTIGKVSALYFQAYQFAVELATQAQNSWMYEKGLLDGSVSFIQNGQWDNLHQGLLAGQSLQLDIERMEAAYMKQDERRLEIKKTIALSTLNTGKNGETLIDALNANGSCGIILTEEMFNKDYPNHYCRQIKSVSISIPAVLGPYENIHATLTQTSNSIQLEAAPSKKMKTDVRANQKIAISGGLNDTGMFQLNFNDERYLPFEGTGAISNWELSIPIKSNPGLQVDPKAKSPKLNLTEVILEIRYTALDG
ncbi:MAG: hypothetical protein MI702_00115, partial [Chlorobiales bacterium]|nr:hypothetical protein [Chlorobiales bacterium]